MSSSSSPLGLTFSAGVHEVLGVVVDEATADRVVLTLPLTSRVHQPYGILHGGVSALVAESAASLGAALAAGPNKHVVGIELNASHLRPASTGTLIATATPLRVGRSVQVWGISLTDNKGRDICQARCTLAVIDPGAVTRPTPDTTPGASPAG